ncbi:unnamed protein product [Durusdinium trenchii]|uniref:Pentatricopeptide repeat-containing protein, chloroplastic n=1 Tax=Durusdinium trenchii TaxID=1381693 RepID=A0ABP0J269_9DINO
MFATKEGGGSTAKALTAKVAKLGWHGAWQSVLLVLEEAHKISQLDVVLCNAGVRACARSQAWQVGLSLLESMLQGRAIPIADCITVNSALSGCAAAADWQRTLQLLEELTTGRWGIEPNTITFNTALNACARSEQWQEALCLLWILDGQGPGSDLVSFNTVMAACEGSGRWQTCVALLEAAQRRGLQGDLVSYNTILSSSARSAWQWALLLAEGLLSQDRRGSLPMADVVTLGTAFVACGEGMQWQAAVSLLHRSQRMRLAPHGALLSLLDCMKVAGRWQEALEIQAQFKAWDGMTFSHVLAVLGTCGRWELALTSVLPEMQKRDIALDSHAYSALLGACTAWASTREAAAASFGSQLLKQANATQVNDIVVENMLRLLEQAELWEDALELLAKEPQRPNLIHYATAASACAKVHCWEMCLELLCHLNQAAARPDLVLRSAAISACERSYQWQHALALLDAMGNDLILPDSVAYSATMLACNKAERWDLALVLLESALRQADKPDDAISVLSAGLGAYAAARDWQRAVQVLLEIQLLAPRAQAKHWLQDAQTTAMFAALQPSGWEQCMVLFQGHANLTSLGCAIRACGMGRQIAEK